jgi:hypothetical protein
MKVSLIYFSLAAAASPCDGFLNLPFVNQANPAVAGYAEAQKSALLKIHLDIGQDVAIKKGAPEITGNRLGVDGLMIDLHGNLHISPDYKHPNLPGANGPNPQLSSGPRALDLVKKGKFVDLSGTQTVDFQDGVWELVWRRNAKAGALICGFNVPEEVKRNGASIPKGRVYMTFPVWTQESLKDLRERKVVAEEKAMEALDRLKEETFKMEQTSNPLMKALHFRNACKAHEAVDYSGWNSYKNMPLDRDMINLKEGLHLCTLGTVWTKKDGFFGGEHTLLGCASVAKGDRGDLIEKKVVTEVVTERELKPVAYDGLRPFE